MKKFPKRIAAAATLNLNGCVYGPPPEDYDEQQSIPYGYQSEEVKSEEAFDPADNFEACVYGPPPSDYE